MCAEVMVHNTQHIRDNQDLLLIDIASRINISHEKKRWKSDVLSIETHRVILYNDGRNFL